LVLLGNLRRLKKKTKLYSRIFFFSPNRKNRGFGFITRKSDGADFFVHSRSIRDADFESINEGIEVEFLEIQTHRGGEAKDIQILKKT